MEKNKKIAIIGSGISGISIASILKDVCDVTVYERSEYIGGLVHCDRVDNYLYHRVGGHVFNSKNKQVLEWFWNKFDKETEFIQTKRNAKILYQNSFIGYPIENFLYQLDTTLMERIISELLEINSRAVIEPMDYSDFEEFLKGNFGDTLYNFYFKPYNEKIWKADLKTVPMHWLEGKLPMPRLLEVITSNIKREAEGNMVHASFFYPKQGGSQFIADRLAEGLTIRTKHALEHIKCLPSGKVRIFEEEYDGLIYTGDVRQLPAMITTDDKKSFREYNEISSLRSNGTSSILCSCDANDLSWLYIPEKEFKAHRIIYTGNFSDTNNKENISGRSSCTVEFSGICSVEEMKSELKQLPGNLKFIDYNTEVNSYVIQDPSTRKAIKAYKEYLKNYNIYLLGRFGEWEYYNMDKAMEAAFELKVHIVN
jgi:protoporphyrinogen oxidase